MKETLQCCLNLSCWLILNKKKIAIIGCGDIALKHAEALQKSEFFELKYCFDIDSKVNKQYADKFGLEIKNIKQIISSDSEAVVIAAPPYTHIDLINEISVSDKIIISENPIGSGFENAVLQNINKKKIFIVQQMRFNPYFKAIKDLYISQKLKINHISVDIFLNRNENYFKKEWRKDITKSGGIWGNQGFHLLDFLINLLGKPIKIERKQIKLHSDEFHIQSELLFLIFKNNITVNIFFSIDNQYSENQSLLKIYGENAYIEISGQLLNKLNYSFGVDLNVEEKNISMFEEYYNFLYFCLTSNLNNKNSLNDAIINYELVKKIYNRR